MFKSLEKVIFLGKECRVVGIDEKREMVKLSAPNILTWVKFTDVLKVKK